MEKRFIEKNKEKPLEEHIKSFSKLICKIDKDTEKINVLSKIKEYFKEYPAETEKYGIKLGRVWILIGKNEDKDNSKYVALQIGQSEDIEKEIQYNIECMFNNTLDDINENERIKAKVYLTGREFEYQNGKSKGQYLYRYLKGTYSCLEFYEVSIDEYLNMNTNNQILDISYDLSKDYIAESKLAIETNPYYWNYYNSGVGKRAYFYFKNKSI